jgi:anti-anti-sigma factor
MSLTVTSKFESGVAHLTLIGRLDANTAGTFKTEIEKVAATKPQTLALFVEKLEYMASAGIRMLVFTKQKLGANVDIYVVAANEQIVNTLEMTGVDKSVIFVDEFEPAAAAPR